MDPSAQPVEAVEGRNLVRFRERRIVEHRIPEVLDRSVKRKHGLPDVNELRSRKVKELERAEGTGSMMGLFPMHSTQVARLLAYVTGVVNQQLLLAE